MFWSDWGRPGRIERAALDGTQRRLLLRGLKRPNGLSIDYSRHRLYWTDTAEKTIEHCELDGLDRQVCNCMIVSRDHNVITSSCYH